MSVDTKMERLRDLVMLDLLDRIARLEALYSAQEKLHPYAKAPSSQDEPPVRHFGEVPL